MISSEYDIDPERFYLNNKVLTPSVETLSARTGSLRRLLT